AARAVRTAFPDLRFRVAVLFGQDDLVTGRWTMTGTHTGPLELLGLPPTGRPVTMSGQEIFRARDGRFVDVSHLADVSALVWGPGAWPGGGARRGGSTAASDGRSARLPRSGSAPAAPRLGASTTNGPARSSRSWSRRFPRRSSRARRCRTRR